MQSKKEKRKCRMKKFNNIIKRHTYRESLENNIIGVLVQIVMSYIPDLNLNKKMVLNDEIKQQGKGKAVEKLRRRKNEKKRERARRHEKEMVEKELESIEKFCYERFSRTFRLDHFPGKGFTVFYEGNTYIFDFEVRRYYNNLYN